MQREDGKRADRGVVLRDVFSEIWGAEQIWGEEDDRGWGCF